jgi:adenylate cyclase
VYTHGDIAPLKTDRARPTASLEHAVREHLERLLHSSQFDASARSRDFLRFIVNAALGGHSGNLNQAVIAVAVFGRSGDFDAVLDPIVRVQAGRLRRSLERYYMLSGNADSIRISLPKGGYAPVFVTVAPDDGGRDAAVKLVAPADDAPDWPTVVIHPFAISSTDEEETASRMQDALTMELCRYADVRVVRQCDMDRLDLRQQASVRFEFQGRVRRAADDCLVGARLVDRTTGEQVWGDEFHTSPKPGRWSSNTDDVGRVIAARIGAEHGVIARVLTREHCSQRLETTGALSAILSCHHFFLSRLGSELVPAVEALRRLTAREPGIPVAWTYLARLYLVNHSFELTDLQTPIEKAISYAYRGVHLDPTGARGRCVLASALLVKGEVQSARDEIAQALRLNPDSLAYREIMGWLMALSGDRELGLALMREAMERNPYCLPHVKHGLWAEYLQRGDFQRAYTAALEYWDSSSFWRELMIACCLGHLGRLDEAQASAAELLHAKPGFPKRGRTLIGYYIKSIELRERIVDGLRKAGLVLT